jgi:hypothetical protein
MKNAKVWISYNPNTGNKRPWEVYFQVDGFEVRFISSCANEEAAGKSLKKLIKRCDGMYSITQ